MLAQPSCCHLYPFPHILDLNHFARWRDIAAREEERADSAKAAVQALLGNAFDYEAARKVSRPCS
jgi:hypothetical protein